MKRFCLVSLFQLLVIMGVSAQVRNVQSDSAKYAGTKELLRIDSKMPDYSVKKIDEATIGPRLAALLCCLEDNYGQGLNNRMIATIIGEQVKSLEQSFFKIRKLKLLKIEKTGPDVVVIYKATLDANKANIKQTVVTFSFRNGVSESHATNELFCTMANYVDSKELFNK